MIKTSEERHQYRFEDHGPKYLMRTEQYDLGVVVLKPNQEFKQHHHAYASETFYTLSGEIHMYVNNELQVLKQGDILKCDPKENHYVVNKGTQDWKAVFIKSPPVDGDSVYTE
ncbi:cupin domain-containing protein [Vibrio maritimus]